MIMKQKTTDNAISEYEKSCKHLITHFCQKQDLDFDYWIGDVIGGIACFNADYFFNLNDIYLDLLKNVAKGLIIKWQDDGVENHFKNHTDIHINYSSYLKGLRYIL